MKDTLEELSDTTPLSLLPENARCFLNKLGLRVLSCEQFSSELKPVFKIVTADAVFFLKHHPRTSGKLARLRYALLGSFGFDRERRFYENVSKTPLAPYVATYFGSDQNNLLISLLPSKCGRNWVPEGDEWVVLARALLAFNWESGLSDSGFRNFVHRSIYGPTAVALRGGFAYVRDEFGVLTALRYILRVLDCIRKQPKLPKAYLCHNDFIPNNFLFSEDSSEVFIIDFQDITSGRRWPLFDLIRVIWHIEGNQHDGLKNIFFENYLNGLDAELMGGLNLRIQVQFSLLICLIHSLRWRKQNGVEEGPLRDQLLELIAGRGEEIYLQKIENSIKSSIN